MQQLETAKGPIDLFQRAAGAGFVYRQPLRRCQERGLQWRLKAALAPRIPTEPTRTAQPSCCSRLPIFIVPLPNMPVPQADLQVVADPICRLMATERRPRIPPTTAR